MDRDHHGYEIRTQLRERLAQANASFGSIYPALARLERQGLVEGEGLIAGEIYRLGPQHLMRLDEVEEMVADDQDASLFWRVRVQIVTGAHATQWVWCYRYNRSVQGFPLVTHGDYRAYLSPC